MTFLRRAAFAQQNMPAFGAAASGITFVGAGTFAHSTAAVTPGLPTGTLADDILVMLCETVNTAITVSGWTEAANSPQSESSLSTRLTVFWKRAVGGDATTTSDSGDHNMAQILGFRGCITSGNPFDVTAGDTNGASSTSVTIPGATTTVANTMCIAVVGNTIGTTQSVDSWANSDLTGGVEACDSHADDGADGGFAAWIGTKATAGVVGSTTATLAVSSRQNRWFGALKPA